MSIHDPWKVTCIADAVSFATYLSGNANGGTFQSTPAFFQRGIEWGEPQVTDAISDIFQPNLDQQLLEIGRKALTDAQCVVDTGGTPGSGMPRYETGTGLSRPYFHEIDIQASKKTDDRLVEIIDGQQRTTFWRCSVMSLACMMIEHNIPVIPRSLSEAMCTNYTRTMTFGPDSSYDRLSKPFCVDLHAAKDPGRAKIRKDHLDAYREVKTRGNDPMVKLYREVDVQLASIVKRIAKADGSAQDGEPSIENIQAALYAVCQRMLFDCEVRINVLPRDTLSGRHFYTKNSRGADLSEHALITSALHEHTLSQDSTRDNEFVTRFRDLTATVQLGIDEGGKRSMKAENLICHATTIALLASHSDVLAKMPSEYLTSLSSCQTKSSGNAFKAICVMMADMSLDAGGLLDALEAILPDFITLYIKGENAKMKGLDDGVMSMFKLCSAGSPSHAVMMARVFGSPAKDVVDLAKALTVMVTVNGAYDLAAKQNLAPKIGRVGATLNHAIVGCIRRAVRGSCENKAPQPENFAKDLMFELVNGSDGGSPYYDKARHDQVIKELHNIEFTNNNLRLLMRQEWHARHGDAATLRDNDIEHILPVVPCLEVVREAGLSGKGIGLIKDCPKWLRLVAKIGNRAWLPKSTNRSVGNGSFSQKKAYFQDCMDKGQGQGADVALLLEYDTFTPDDVEKLGKQKAERIDRLWKNWIPAAGLAKPAKMKKGRTRAVNDDLVRVAEVA